MSRVVTDFVGAMAVIFVVVTLYRAPALRGCRQCSRAPAHPFRMGPRDWDVHAEALAKDVLLDMLHAPLLLVVLAAPWHVPSCWRAMRFGAWWWQPGRRFPVPRSSSSSSRRPHRPSLPPRPTPCTALGIEHRRDALRHEALLALIDLLTLLIVLLIACTVRGMCAGAHRPVFAFALAHRRSVHSSLTSVRPCPTRVFITAHPPAEPDRSAALTTRRRGRPPGRVPSHEARVQDGVVQGDGEAEPVRLHGSVTPTHTPWHPPSHTHARVRFDTALATRVPVAAEVLPEDPAEVTRVDTRVPLPNDDSDSDNSDGDDTPPRGRRRTRGRSPAKSTAPARRGRTLTRSRARRRRATTPARS